MWISDTFFSARCKIGWMMTLIWQKPDLIHIIKTICDLISCFYYRPISVPVSSKFGNQRKVILHVLFLYFYILFAHRAGSNWNLLVFKPPNPVCGKIMRAHTHFQSFGPVLNRSRTITFKFNQLYTKAVLSNCE